MAKSGEVVSINVSAKKGTVKTPVAEAVLDACGIVGDAHAGPWHRQVSLLAGESVDELSAKAERPFQPGEFAENLTVRGLDLRRAALLDRFVLGSSNSDVVLEVTQIGKECHGAGCAIFREVGECVMPREGIFCRVIAGGHIQQGAAISHRPRVFRCAVITLSDRAAAGEYEDRAGPAVEKQLARHCAERGWRHEIERAILPDAADQLREALLAARDRGLDAAFTTGGTGVGPRDVTPETVAAVCDKLIPGVMEHIRLKFGAEKPNALLSRSVAGLAGKTLIYALPGSPKAVDEYMGEILKTLEHLILMVNGLDTH